MQMQVAAGFLHIETKMDGRAYLDWNATSPLRQAAAAAVRSVIDSAGNPSSVHAEGRAARAIVENARGEVAALVGADPRNVVFTSGASEANAMALTPQAADHTGGGALTRLLVSVIEHPSVRAGGRFDPESIEVLPVTPDGVVDLDALAEVLARTRAAGERMLVSVMAANNETGVIQPVADVARLVHEAGGLLHVDATQAVGRISVDINAIGADLLTLSSHKLGGPQGAGALVLGSDRITVPSLIPGGGQERGRRGGTENVAAIAGFGAAAGEARRQRESEAVRLLTLRGRLECGLQELAGDTVIFGRDAERVPNTVLFAVAGIRAETALILLDLEGIAVSSGAACSSGKVTPSHVLAAMGVPPGLAACAVRVSMGWSTGERELEMFLKAWRKCLAALGKDRHRAAA